VRFLLANATIVLPDRVVEKGWVVIDQDRIGSIGYGAYPQTPTNATLRS
jgi:alpha-D-ribose 1-methylphosphonate 5-triphosphate diphosphatase